VVTVNGSPTGEVHESTNDRGRKTREQAHRSTSGHPELHPGGHRSGTDMAAYNANGKWHYDPYRVYNGVSVGTPPYNSWTDECHESLHAPIRRIGEDFPGVKVANLACSGATNKNLWLAAQGGVGTNGRNTQIFDLARAVKSSEDLKLIAISAGGNDAGFGAVIEECITAWAKKNVPPVDVVFPYDQEMCRDDVEAKILPKIPDVYYNLAKTVDQVRERLAQLGQPEGTYRIVLMGYPMILPTETNDWRGSEGDLSQRCPIRKDDSKWINENFVPRLNTMVRAVADEKGVGFIDLTEAFVGHRLCEAGTVRGSAAVGSSAQAEWVRFVDLDFSMDGLFETLSRELLGFPVRDGRHDSPLVSQRSIRESFHPNYWGQRAIGKCLSLYYGNTNGSAKVKCTNGGGQTGTVDQMVLSSLPTTKWYTDDPKPDIAVPQASSAPLERKITVTSSKPITYVQVFVDMTHPRKGQLRVRLRDPEGYVYGLRDFNPNDTGAWFDGRWTFAVPTFPPSVPPKDPSGNWTLMIWDSTNDSYSGTLNAWDLRIY
jgi:subtilisin-like proprotein convertase family protein